MATDDKVGPPRSAPMRWLVVRALALALGVVLSLVVLEIGVRSSGQDVDVLARSLWYQTANSNMHQVSDDPFLHFELGQTDAEREFGQLPGIRHSINRHGARGVEYTVDKPPEVWRVLCFGGSSMFGCGVADEATACAALERRAQSLVPDGVVVETWNFGTNAYNLAQMAHLAQSKLNVLAPDVVVVLLSNTGRRAFLQTPEVDAGDYSALQLMDGWLHEENVPAAFSLPPWLHRGLLRVSAIYRWLAGRHALETMQDGISPPGDVLSRRVATELTRQAEARDIHLMYVPVPGAAYLGPEDVHSGLAAHHFLDIRDPDMPPGYNAVHPQRRFLDAWALRIAAGLHDRGMLPAGDPVE